MILENIAYATLLNELGDRIVETSQTFPNEEEVRACNSKQELKSIFETCNLGFERFKETGTRLATVVPPSIIKDEHKELIDAFNNFLTGTKMLVSSYDAISGVCDIERYHLGIANQVIAEARTKSIVERIALKILK